MDIPPSAINENLVNKDHHPKQSNEKQRCARVTINGCLRKLNFRKKCDRKVHTDAEENVSSWLYTLAQAQKDMVFEYVKSTERGLSFKEAERRLKEDGRNIPLNHTYCSWWPIWWNAFLHPFNIILITMAILSFIAADNANGIIMIILVLISVGLRFYQEYSSSKAAMQLSELLKSPIRVQRCAGRLFQTEIVVQIDQRDIVPGDIVRFSPGDLFPGDVRLLTSKELVVSQSSLTGESGTMEKLADIREERTTPLLELKNICFMGTNVVSGSGTGLVISTGSRSYMSTIFSNLGKKKPQDAFEKGIICVSYAIISMMVVVAPVIILSGYYTSRNLSESIIFGISVSVALTPQMFPLIVNTNLAKGAIAMARRRCIVKNLSAIRNMGAMDILCIDKTGTLTMDQVIMVHHLDTRAFHNERVLRFAFLNSYFKTELKGPIDDAILAYVYTSGYKFSPSEWRKIDEAAFDFVRRRMSVIVETAVRNALDGSHPSLNTIRLVITKGALEEVLNICTSFEDIDRGVTSSLGLEDRQRILQMSEALSDDGLRVLGVAIRSIKANTKDLVTYNETIESDMVFLGLLSFYDPPKGSAKQAIRRLAEKGVETKVLTGDSFSLAIKVCKEVGIKIYHVTTGPDLELLNDDDFHETVNRVTVLARLTPTQKLRVIKSLQMQGTHVVGFLGDGINDSLALDAANVGISVDSGASAAKDLADIILLEKDLNVLVSGVELGRITYGNTMKFIKMSLVANIGSIVSLLIVTLLLPFEPLTPRQLLTQNFLYNLGQIAIPWDEVEEDFAKTPQQWSSEQLPVFILCNGLVCSIFDIITFLVLCFYYQANRITAFPFFHSAWFVEGLLMQELILHMIRTQKIPFIEDSASWPVIFSSITVSFVGVVIPFTPVGRIMGLAKVPLSYFGFLVVLFLGYFTLAQVVKKVYILIYKQWL